VSNVHRNAITIFILAMVANTLLFIAILYACLRTDKTEKQSVTILSRSVGETYYGTEFHLVKYMTSDLVSRSEDFPTQQAADQFIEKLAEKSDLEWLEAKK